MLLQNRHLIVTLCMVMMLTGIAINPNSSPDTPSKVEQRFVALNAGIEKGRNIVAGLIAWVLPDVEPKPTTNKSL